MSQSSFPTQIQHPAEFGKVAVLYGGLSGEREVSLRSGAGVLQALQTQQIDAHGIDVGHDVLSVLAQGCFDRVFLALHGKGGEDGTIQGALDIMQIPYTGSDVLASALSMDKVRTKWLWQALSMPTPPSLVIHSEEDIPRVLDEIGLPLAIKPATEGSSLGITKVERAADVLPAWRLAHEMDSVVLAEKWISGRGEFTGSILKQQALPLIRMETDLVFYDYAAKYQRDDTRYFCPAGLDAAEEYALRELCLAAFHAVGAQGFGRVDFVLDSDGKPWLLEINTLPGLTSHSLVPKAAAEVGLNYNQLCWQILETSF